MKYPIHISKQKSHFIVKDNDRSMLTRGDSLLEVIENLEFMAEQLEPDPDEGLELTAKAKRRLAYAQRAMISGKKSTGLTLEQIRKKYRL